MGVEGLEIKLAFPSGAEETVQVCLVQNGYGTTSATHTLVACDFGDIDQNWWGSNAVSGDVVRGDLVAKACKTYWVRPAGRCLGISSAS